VAVCPGSLDIDSEDDGLVGLFEAPDGRIELRAGPTMLRDSRLIPETWVAVRGRQEAPARAENPTCALASSYSDGVTPRTRQKFAQMHQSAHAEHVAVVRPVQNARPCD